MKLVFILLSQFFFGSFVLAHDEGHGPKLGDQPKYGGTVTAVIDYAELDNGREAKLLYKAELTKNAGGLIRVYFYDKDMKPVSVEPFDSVSGELIYRDRKAKKSAQKNISMKKKKGHFEGKLPIKPQPPFNIDVKVRRKDNGKILFMAFDNLS